MIIKDVRLTRDGEITILSANCKIRKIGWDRVYFKVTGNHDNVFNDASPFAAALLIPSMKQGEDLIIHGRISEQLLSGMKVVMAEVLSWNIGLKPIEIKVDEVVADSHKASQTGTFFSGGVDSFYTYLKHKHDPEPGAKIDSLILVNGFDIDLRSTRLWRDTVSNISAVAQAEGVELVLVETNIEKLLEPIIAWDFAHGGCLAAVGLFLRQGFGRIYIPSTFTADNQLPWGSHLNLDKHWSTEKLLFVHDGTEATRVNKVAWQIAKSPTALQHLRVCYMNENGQYNCGMCSKCQRTMINLYLAGVLDQAVTFPRPLVASEVADRMSAINDGVQLFVGEDENLEALRERQLAPELQAAIQASKAKTMAFREGSASKRTRRLKKLVDRGLYIDHVYIYGRGYVILSSLFGRKFV